MVVIAGCDCGYHPTVGHPDGAVASYGRLSGGFALHRFLQGIRLNVDLLDVGVGSADAIFDAVYGFLGLLWRQSALEFHVHDEQRMMRAEVHR